MVCSKCADDKDICAKCLKNRQEDDNQMYVSNLNQLSFNIVLYLQICNIWGLSFNSFRNSGEVPLVKNTGVKKQPSSVKDDPKGCEEDCQDHLDEDLDDGEDKNDISGDSNDD